MINCPLEEMGPHMEIITHVLTTDQPALQADSTRQANARKNIGATGTVTKGSPLPEHPDGYIEVNADTNDVTIHFPEGTDVSNKADKVVGAVANNFAGLDASGNLIDSGSKADDFATAAQGALADTAVQSVTVPATPDGTIVVDDEPLTVYNHPTGTVHESAAVKVGNDALGHVVLGSALTKGDVGLGNVDNTSDADKPISNDTQAALDEKVDAVDGKGLSTNDFTDAYKEKLDGISDEANKVTVPVQPDGTIEIDGVPAAVYEHPATTAHEAAAVKVGNDALGHVVLGSALTKGDVGLDNVDNTSDANKPISNDTQAALDEKVDKVEGMGLSSNDFTDSDKTKLDGIEPGAQVNDIETVKVNGTALTPDANKAVNIDISGKADKVANATENNFAGLDSHGNLTDSGSKAADFATAAQGAKADTAIQGVKVNDTLLVKDGSNIVNAQIDSIVPPQNNGEWIWSDEKDASNSMGWRQIVRDYVGNIQRDNLTGEPILDEEGHPITDAEDAADAVELWLRYKGIEFAARRAYADETGENIHTAIHNRTTMAQVIEAIETALANYGGFKVVPLVNGYPDPSPDLPSEKFIYLTKEDPSAKTDPYTEWIWISGTPDGHWDCIGETSIDLSDYWHGDINTTGSGNVVTNVEVSSGRTVTVTKGKTVSDGANKVEASTTNGNILIDGVETTVYEHPNPDPNYPAYGLNLYKMAVDSKGHIIVDGNSPRRPTLVTKQDLLNYGILEDLDAEVTSVDGTNVQVKVTEADGVITAVNITTDNTLNASDIAGKADMVTGATSGNFAGLDSNGNLTDSGSKASDFATAAQGAKADSAVQGVQKNGTDITLDANKKANVIVNDAEFKVKLGSGSATKVFSADAGTDSTLDIPLAAADSSGATTEYTEGLMTGEDKEKLDGITDYVVSASVSGRTLTLTNKNGPATTFTDNGDTNVIESISVNSVPLTPDANKNVDVTVPDAANDATITIEVGGAASGETDPVAGDFSTDQDTAETITIPAAVSATQNTPAKPGVMSSADKEKLDGIEAGAEVNEVETISIGGGTPIAPTANTTNIDIPMASYDDSTTPHSYTPGAMAGADKEKLDNLKNFSQISISDGATPPVVVPITPSSADDTLTLVSGTNITLSPHVSSKTVTINAVGGNTVSGGRGVSVIESTTSTGKDYNVSVDGAVGYLGGMTTINNVQTSPTDLLDTNYVPSINSGNDRFLIDVDSVSGNVYLYALKTVKDISDPSNDVAGVDVFTLSYNVQVSRTQAHGFYGMAGVQLVRDASATMVLHSSTESYPSTVGECSVNGSTTVWNNAGTTTTIGGKDYYGYRLLYVGDTSLSAQDIIRVDARFSVVENMTGTAEYTGTVNSYQGGDGITIDQNNIVSVNPGDGLIVDSSNNTLKINVKQGGGLAFEQDGQLMAIALDQVTEAVVDTVKEISSDMESKLTTNFPYPMITEVSYDFGSLNVNGSCICQLFSVPFRHPIIAGETYVTVYAKDNGYSQTNVMFGIYEYDPAGNNGTGDTRFVCDTGAVSLYKQQTNSVLEFPITHVDPVHNALYPNCMYYAVLALPPNAGSGIFLAAAPNYNAPVNSMPTLNWRITNCNLIDWDHPADASIDRAQVPWSQSGYNEHNSMYRFFMQIRNHTQQNNSGN